MMVLITLDEAKAYLRVDSADEDAVISGLLTSAAQISADVARLTSDEKTAVFDTVPTDGDTAELTAQRALLRIAALYALGYLFEHREEADHHDLTMTLRTILHAVREGRLFG